MVNKHRIKGLKKLGNYVSIHPWKIIIGTIIITILMIMGSGIALETGHSQFRTNINDLFPDYPETKVMENIQSDFGDVEAYIVLIKADDVLTPQVFEKTLELEEKFKNDSMVWDNIIGENDYEKDFSIVSLPTILIGYKSNFQIMNDTKYANSMFNSSEEIKELIRSYLVNDFNSEVNKSLLSSLLPKDFNPNSNVQVGSMAMYISLDSSISDKELEKIELHMRDDIIKDVRGEGVEMYSYAFGLLSPSYAEAEATMEPLFMITVLAIFILSLINYRRVSDALLANLTVLIVVIWTFCIIGIFGFDYNFLNIMVPLLIVGLAIDFSFHAIIGYRERLWGKNDQKKLVKNAAIAMISFVGVAFVLATVTTTFGFLSNLVSDLPAIGEFGTTAALGIIFACVLNLTFVPAMRVVLDLRRIKKGKELKGAIPPEKISTAPGKVLGPLFKTVKFPWALIVVLIILAVPGYVLLSDMRAAYDPTGELMETQEITKAFRTLNDDYSVGTESILVRVDGNFEDPSLWQAVNVALDNSGNDEYIATVNNDSKVEWLGTILPTVGFQDPSYFDVDKNRDGIPDSDSNPEKIKLLFDNLSVVYPIIKQFIHKGPGGYDGVLIRFISRTNIGEYGLDAKNELKDDFTPVYDIGAKVKYTGEPIIWNKGLDDFRESLIMSTILVLIFAFVLLIIVFGILYKSPLLGFLTALAPILAIGWTLSFMAIFSIPLNMMTAFVGSFTVGLGIDYPIHLVTRWVEEKKKGKSIIQCYTISLRSTGKELGFSALTTLSAFIAFAMMPMEVMRQFGIVMVASIIFSFLGAVIMMPMLIRFWHRKD